MTSRTSIPPALLAVLVIGTRALVAQGQPARKPSPGPPPKPGTIVITAALVDRDMQVRPVPLHALLLTGAGSDTFSIRTGTDGRASLSVPPGTYTLSSVAPTEFQGRRFRWRLVLSIASGTRSTIDLTNDNAEADAGATPAVQSAYDGRMDPAAALFER